MVFRVARGLVPSTVLTMLCSRYAPPPPAGRHQTLDEVGKRDPAAWEWWTDPASGNVVAEALSVWAGGADVRLWSDRGFRVFQGSEEWASSKWHWDWSAYWRVEPTGQGIGVSAWMPCVDLDPTVDGGGLRFCDECDRWCDDGDAPCYEARSTTPAVQRGDVIFFDQTALHRGENLRASARYQERVAVVARFLVGRPAVHRTHCPQDRWKRVTWCRGECSPLLAPLRRRQDPTPYPRPHVPGTASMAAHWLASAGWEASAGCAPSNRTQARRSGRRYALRMGPKQGSLVAEKSLGTAAAHIGP